MKRVIGIFLLVLFCILLGLSVDYFDDGDTSLITRCERCMGEKYDG